MIMHVASSFVNCWLNENPTSLKNRVVLARSFTGKLMNVFLDIALSLLDAIRSLLPTGSTSETHRGSTELDSNPPQRGVGEQEALLAHVLEADGRLRIG